jgi:hypothetical protein
MTDPYYPRELTGALRETLETMPVVVLSGARQTGKSTLLHQESGFRDRVYQTLDDYAVLQTARQNPEALLDVPQPLTIDEAQRSPELWPALKAAVDRQRRPGRFVLSGSANLSLLAKVSESLAGRAVYFALHPMSRREIRRQTRRRPALVEFLEHRRLPSGSADPVEREEVLRGGLPPVCLGSGRGRDIWFRGYVQTYVERDVRQFSQITDLVAFRTLVSLAALRTAQVMNISQLGRDAQLTAATTTRFLQLLETSFLVRRLPSFRKNRGSRLLKAPKLLFTDSGLAAYLSQFRTPDTALWGALLETWVAQNVSSILEAHLPQAELSYWHEQGRHEVDLVIESAGRVYALEIKSATRWSDSDLSGLRAFLDRTPQCEAAILAYNGRSVASLSPKLWAIPLGHLLA